jgi:hypothetical protein
VAVNINHSQTEFFTKELKRSVYSLAEQNHFGLTVVAETETEIIRIQPYETLAQVKTEIYDVNIFAKVLCEGLPEHVLERIDIRIVTDGLPAQEDPFEVQIAPDMYPHIKLVVKY